MEILIANNPPSKYGLDNESVEIQMNYLISILGDIKPTHFYSSEPYGKCVADFLGIIDRRVDSLKKKFPISATEIRENIENYKYMIPELVYRDLKNK